MSLSWKDALATVSVLIIAVLTISLLAGFMEDVSGRWALGSLAIFLIAVATGLITGTASIVRNRWSKMAYYVLSASAIIFTLVNAFVNSQVWLVAVSVTAVLLWVEFVTVDLVSKAPSTHTPTRTSMGGTL